MYFIIIVSVLAACFVTNSNGQSACTTPSNDKGECVSIYDCDQLLSLINKEDKTQQELQLLQKSNCGYKGGTITVCCPVKCVTPEGQSGKCVSIYSCPHIANRLRKPVSQKNREYVQKSQCSDSDQFSVCCGPAPALTKNPSNDINAICSTKQTAFPPDPNSRCCGFESTVGNKIIGGKATSLDQYPWLALIEYDRIVPGNPLLCGGALISARYVLTAAHCISVNAIEKLGTPIFVRLGEYDTSKNGNDCVEVEAGGLDCTNGEVRIIIVQYIPHPEYSELSKKNDIGLIRLATMAPFTDFIRPICLPTYDITVNPPPLDKFILYAAGWGSTGDTTFSSIKLHVDLPYVDLQKCKDAYSGRQNKANLWNRQLCAGGQLRKDTCKGDSGGPLMYQNGRYFEILGVVSFGHKSCGQLDIPGVYTKVFAYRNWILNTITN